MRSLRLWTARELERELAATWSAWSEHRRRCGICWCLEGPRCARGLPLWRALRLVADRESARRALRAPELRVSGRGVDASDTRGGDSSTWPEISAPVSTFYRARRVEI